MQLHSTTRAYARSATRACVIAVACAVVLAGSAAAQEQAKSATKPEGSGAQAKLERGRYLIGVMGCHDCHSPKIMGPAGPAVDSSRPLSGHPADSTPAPLPPGTLSPTGWMAACNSHMTAWVGPWGTSFAINLTPDQDTGIGSWSEAMFVKALRTGKHMGEGRPILPPMPVAVYAHATDEDLSAIFAYLQSLAPVKNIVPDPLPPAGAGGGHGK